MLRCCCCRGRVRVMINVLLPAVVAIGGAGGGGAATAAAPAAVALVAVAPLEFAFPARVEVMSVVLRGLDEAVHPLVPRRELLLDAGDEGEAAAVHAGVALVVMLFPQLFLGELALVLLLSGYARLKLEGLLHHDDLWRVRPPRRLRVVLQLLLMRPLPLPLMFLRPTAAHRPPLLLLALRRGRRRDGLLRDLLLDPLHVVAEVESEMGRRNMESLRSIDEERDRSSS